LAVLNNKLPNLRGDGAKPHLFVRWREGKIIIQTLTPSLGRGQGVGIKKSMSKKLFKLSPPSLGRGQGVGIKNKIP